MVSKQNIVGNATENEIAKLFKEHKYLAFIIPKKIGGQPFDIIGCNKNNVWLIDAKHLESNKASFPFERIEPNQRTSMKYAEIVTGIETKGFVIKWERDVSRHFFLSYDKLIELEKNGAKSIPIKELEVFEDLL